MMRDMEAGTRGVVELLVFRIARELFAVELAAVDEAIELEGIRGIPDGPPTLLGVVSLRGSLLPVYSPATALNLPVRDPKAALVVRHAERPLAVAIDDVDGVLTLDHAEIRDAPASDAPQGLVAGIGKRGGRLVAILDVDVLVSCIRAGHVVETG